MFPKRLWDSEIMLSTTERKKKECYAHFLLRFKTVSLMSVNNANCIVGTLIRWTLNHWGYYPFRQQRKRLRTSTISCFKMLWMVGRKANIFMISVVVQASPDTLSCKTKSIIPVTIMLFLGAIAIRVKIQKLVNCTPKQFHWISQCDSFTLSSY